MKAINRTLVLVAVIGSFVVPVIAESSESKQAEGHQAHKHHVSLFLGNTHDYHSEDAFTVGVEYELRVHEFLGLAALIDHAAGDVDSTVAGAGIMVHPCGDLRLLAAGANDHHAGDDEFIVRLGAMYDFWVDGWSITPSINVDLLEDNEENWVYGVGIGRGF